MATSRASFRSSRTPTSSTSKKAPAATARRRSAGSPAPAASASSNTSRSSSASSAPRKPPPATASPQPRGPHDHRSAPLASQLHLRLPGDGVHRRGGGLFLLRPRRRLDRGGD